ncbi:acid phosphatase family membrane protein YuiD [Flavobacterium sp. W4I14]|nr:acid phosphatase family membrane protein YuiD [Flavobacterium sp. W4I14]
MGLSGLGIFHTIIGIVAIVAAIISFVRFGKIDLTHLSGKTYFYTTAVTALTALGISKHGGFNAGHIFSVFIFILVVVAFWLSVKRSTNNKARYIENFLLSFSFFLSLIPTVNETFTRVPLGHPLAKNPTDPIIAQTLLVLLIAFVAGAIYQYIKQRNALRIR